MANKYYRQNLKSGTNPFSKKSNIAKIMEVFGVKKKVKKPKKRMMANKGGGADYMNTVKPEKRGNPAVITKTRKNRMGGGMMSRRKFSDGGLTFSTSNLSANNNGLLTKKDLDGIAAAINSQRVTVTEATITGTQKSVGVLESRASF